MIWGLKTFISGPKSLLGAEMAILGLKPPFQRTKLIPRPKNLHLGAGHSDFAAKTLHLGAENPLFWVPTPHFRAGKENLCCGTKGSHLGGEKLPF